MSYNKVVIPFSQVYKNQVTNVKVYMEYNNGTLIDGTVLDPDGNPVPNAGIEIIQVSKVSSKENTIGCIFTDAFGRYAFTLYMNPKSYYKFKLYSKI